MPKLATTETKSQILKKFSISALKTFSRSYMNVTLPRLGLRLLSKLLLPLLPEHIQNPRRWSSSRRSSHRTPLDIDIQNLVETISGLFRFRAARHSSMFPATGIFLQLSGQCTLRSNRSRGNRHYSDLLAHCGVVYVHCNLGQHIPRSVPYPCTPQALL